MLQKCHNCSYRGSTSLSTNIIEPSTQWVFTCSKLPIETVEQGVKSFKVNIKDTQKMSNDVALVSLLRTLYIVLVNSVEFEKVNGS